MVSFPDNLPPEGLDSFYKALIYLGIIYFIATAFTSWLITRKRAKPQIQYREPRESAALKNSPSAVTQISFEDSKDMLASLKVEIAGAEASITQLGLFKDSGQISNEAYNLLYSQYSTEVVKFTNKMNEMLKADIVSSSTGEIESGMTEEDMSDIEADLERSLADLEDEDDFLAPRARTRRRSSIADAPLPTDVTTTITPAPKHEKVEVTNPPPPTSMPPPTASAPPPAAVPPPDKPKTSPPPPTKIGEAVPAPSPEPSIAAVPPPPAKPSPTPSASTPHAAQPMKVEATEPGKEKIFAKSTSIAALRMDMLRELARLKKLINEDE